jgi:hypothetical protein
MVTNSIKEVLDVCSLVFDAQTRIKAARFYVRSVCLEESLALLCVGKTRRPNVALESLLNEP